MDKYSEFVAKNSTTQASINGKLPFTKPSSIYSNLGKDAIKQYGQSKEFEKIIDSLWDRELTRNDVFDIFRKEKDLYKGFIAAMLWGGLGSDALSRNNLRYAFNYSKADIEEKLNDLSQKLKANKIAEAFESMLPRKSKKRKSNKISGIGISFFTKLLYFLWPEENKQEVKPLIYDKWSWHIHAALLIDEKGIDEALKFFVLSATINHKAGYGLIPQVVLKDGKNVSAAYMNYIELLSKKSHGNPGRLEEFLFGQSRKENKQESNPRVFLMKCLSRQIDLWIKKTTFDYSVANEENEQEVDTSGNDEESIPGRTHCPEYRFPTCVNGDIIYVYVARDKVKRFCEIWHPKHYTYPNETLFVEKGFKKEGGMHPYLIRDISKMEEPDVMKFLESCLEILKS